MPAIHENYIFSAKSNFDKSVKIAHKNDKIFVLYDIKHNLVVTEDKISMCGCVCVCTCLVRGRGREQYRKRVRKKE